MDEYIKPHRLSLVRDRRTGQTAVIRNREPTRDQEQLKTIMGIYREQDGAVVLIVYGAERSVTDMVERLAASEGIEEGPHATATSHVA